jgi:hypothetical protein
MIQPTSHVPSETLEQRMMRSIHEALDKKLKELKEQIIRDAITTFDNELRAAVGTAAIKISEYYSMERLGPNLVITVRLEDKR